MTSFAFVNTLDATTISTGEEHPRALLLAIRLHHAALDLGTFAGQGHSSG